MLLAVASDRDEAAFAALFSHYGPRIKAFLMRTGTDAAIAEELTQEAMVSVWRKAVQFDPSRAGASAWVYAIARNLRIDMLRRERRPELDPNDPALVPEPEESADRKVGRLQDEEKLRQAMADLPDDQAQVVRLSFYEDKPHAAIADELGLPLGTVKSRLRLAFRRIRKVVGEEE